MQEIEDIPWIKPQFSRYQWAVRYNIESHVDFALFVTYMDAKLFIDALGPDTGISFHIAEIDWTLED